MSTGLQEDGPDRPGFFSGLPGEPMMWILIVSELVAFGMALVGYAVARALDASAFDTAQSELDPIAGAANTAVLLTSGAFAALAVRACRSGEKTKLRLALAAAGLLGLAFLVIKIFEYSHHVDQGYGMEGSVFFTLYYLITGFHAAHVVFGLIILVIIGVFCSEENVVTGTAFWHMVDLIWVLVFAVFYLS